MIIKEKIIKEPNLIKKDLIGIGTIGKVYKIAIPNEKQVFALKEISKIIPKNFITPIVNFSQKVKRPYFAKLYEYFEDDKNYYFLMEYYQNNLSYYMKGGIQIKYIFKIIEKINTILLDLNLKNLIFRNIKPENIFIVNNNGNLEESFDVILSDCCNIYLALFHEKPKYFAFKNFFAPEIRNNGNIDVKSELWSLGRLIYSLLFSISNKSNPYIFEYNFFDCIKYDELKSFLKNLLEQNPNKRMTWNEYIEEFSVIKDKISSSIYDEIIDVFKISNVEPTTALLKPTEDFCNIVIELTELSKEEYVNENYLCPEDFDSRGNRGPFQYSKNQKRGNEDYVPPLGWTGIGLNITEFEDWEIKCSNNNQKGEWSVAYHGTSLSLAKNIIMEGFRKGRRQKYRHSKDIEGKIVGKGVYFTPLIEIAESYSTPCNRMLCAFMCRVNPTKIKKVLKNSIYVVNEPSEDVIPYRLLVKYID